MSHGLDCEVGLLIGYNCPQALLPRAVISGKEDELFAMRSVLGWSIIGRNNSSTDYEDEIGVSHRIILKQVLPCTEPSSQLKSEVHFVFRNQLKEMTALTDIIKLESDFNERANEILISQEDIRVFSKAEGRDQAKARWAL